MNEQQHRELLRAQEVKRLLENSLLREAFDALEEKYITAWRNSQASSPEEREKVYWLITALDEVKAQLTGHITTGKMVKKELETDAYREGLNDESQGISLSYGISEPARTEV